MVDRRATAPPAPKREARRAVGSAARLQADTPSGGVSAGEADLLREQVILPEGERSSAENERDSNRTRWRPPSASGKGRGGAARRQRGPLVVRYVATLLAIAETHSDSVTAPQIDA